MIKKALAKKLLDCGIIHEGEVILRSGKKASFYIDLKKVYGYPVVKLFLPLLRLKGERARSVCLFRAR